MAVFRLVLKTANCHNGKPPTVTTKNRQLPQQKNVKYHKTIIVFS